MSLPRRRIRVDLAISDNFPAFSSNSRLTCSVGTQTDGLRHFGCLEMNCFYQGVPSESIKPGPIDIADPLDLTKDQLKIGISGWAQHGVTGRGGQFCSLFRIFERGADFIVFSSPRYGFVLPARRRRSPLRPLDDLRRLSRRSQSLCRVPKDRV